MLTKKANDELTQIGPGTPMGALLRRYWHPVAASAQLDDEPVLPVTILGESLVLFRDRQGRPGLVADRCAHRSMHLEYGIPEAEGLRCPYHGWMYDATGQCLETPLEPRASTLASKVQITAYPVQEMGGLVFAYLGPEPAPLLPRWHQLTRDDGFRQIIGTMLPCNWLQCMENRLDTMHGIFLHGNFFQYILERQGKHRQVHDVRMDWKMRRAVTSANRDHAERLIFEPYEYGIDKYVVMETGRIDRRPPVVFPYSIADTAEDGEGFRKVWQIGVPVDDTHTWHLSYYCYVPGGGVEVPPQERVGYADVPLTDEAGKPILDYVLAQDQVAWWAQGDITDRSQEKLAQTDTGIIMFRRLLKEQMDLVQEGGDPINVFRDPAQNVSLRIPPARYPRAPSRDAAYRNLYHLGYIEDDVDRYCPDKEIVLELARRSAEAHAPADSVS